MGFVDGRTYRFVNKYFNTHALNVYGTNAASTGRNVCLYTDDDTDIMQDWVVREYAYDEENEVYSYRLHSAVNNNYVLDCSDGSLSNSYANNAHLCKTTQTSATDSVVKFVKDADNLYRIYLPGKNLYLTATNTSVNSSGLPASAITTSTALTGGTGGQSNVYWTSRTNSTKQKWIVSPEVDVDDDSGSSSSSSLHQKLILPLAATCLTASYKNTAYRNRFTYVHYGIDMTCPDQTIKASGTGTLIAKGWDEKAGNVVVIKYPGAYHHTTGQYEDVIFRYFHLSSINSDIPTGTNQINSSTILGQYGGSGMGEMNHWSIHLHVEADTDTSHPCYSPTFGIGGSIIKGTSSGANDSTCYSALEYLHRKALGSNAQTYTTKGDEYINSGDDSIPTA